MPRHHRPFAATLPLYPFHDPRQKARFLDLVREHLGRGGRRVVIQQGQAVVEGSGVVHALTNLAQMCHQEPPERWPAIVAEHLDKSSDERCMAIVTDHIATDYAEAAPKLGVRIHDEDFANGPLGAHFVHRVDLPGTCSVVVVDIGPSVVPLPRPIAEQWGVPPAELFARALANLPKLGAPRWETLPLPGAFGRIELLSGDFYAAAHALLPATFSARAGAFGNLVIVPTREVLVSHPIDGPLSPTTIEAMLRMAHGKFQDGPGSITPDPYWRTPAGEFHRQQGRVDGAKAQFVPSPELLELMMRLRRAP